MFWKKKQVEAPPVQAGSTPAPAGEVEKPSALKPQVKAEKLQGPQEMPELVGRHLVVAKKRDADWVWRLKTVLKKSDKGKKAFDVRVFDENLAAQKKAKVKDWTTLDAQPDLILYEGWFDKDSMKVELEEKKQERISTAVPPTSGGDKIFTMDEIWQQIAGLTEPGSIVFFYLAGSPSSGGPLGRGAAVVELNPNYPGKKQKRYNVYTDDVNGLELAGKRQKMFDSDKSKEVANWIKDRHHKYQSA